MPAPAFTLRLPAEEPYRALAAESIRVYLRVSGAAPEGDAEAFVTSVAEAVDRLAAAGPELEIVVVAQPTQVDVQLSCGAATETLSHAAGTTGG